MKYHIVVLIIISLMPHDLGKFSGIVRHLYIFFGEMFVQRLLLFFLGEHQESSAATTILNPAFLPSHSVFSPANGRLDDVQTSAVRLRQILFQR